MEVLTMPARPGAHGPEDTPGGSPQLASAATVSTDAPVRAYVLGSGSAVRRVRRLLREIGCRTIAGTTGIPGEVRRSHTVELFVVAHPEAPGALQAVRSWSAMAGVAVVGFAGRRDAARLELFDAGAEDVWDPQMRPEEAVRRLRVLMRRVARPRAVVVTSQGHSLVVSRNESRVDGVALRLSPTRQRLLLVLANARGQVVSGDDLVRGVWGYSHLGDPNFVHTQVSRLRRALDVAGFAGALVTHRGIGYSLTGTFED